MIHTDCDAFPGGEEFHLRSRLIIPIIVIQSFLFLVHWLIYETWIHFWPTGASAAKVLGIVFVFLALSFVSASLLAFRSHHTLVRIFYTLAGVWLGTVNFLTWACGLCWLTLAVVRWTGVPVSRPEIVATFFGLALAASLYGVINAALVRVRRVTVKLPGLPETWRGRHAALVTDTHLGHVRGHRFMVRILRLLRQLQPDVVFISGDLFDGTRVDHQRLTLSWKNAAFPFGVFFVTGNHDEFSDSPEQITAITQSGIRVLNNEKVTVDGLQILGVNYRDSTDLMRLQSVLEQAGVDRTRASILLSHAPHGLTVVEQQGVSLQLSGHTHGGQIFPFTWFTWRIFRQYTYGLQQHGGLAVYTSSGAGTWGPPMRVGTKPEVVLLTFA